RPIGSYVVTQVVPVVTHVERDAVVDLARSLVPQRFRIAVVPYRSIGRVPNLNLLPRPSAIAQHSLHLAVLLNRNFVLPFRRAHDEPRHLHPVVPRLEKRVVVVVDIDCPIAAEINGIRIERPSPPKKVWIKNLCAERFPSAGGPSGGWE